MVNIENLDGVLKCLSNRTSTRSIIKKISTELIQLLLAYAFQVSTLLSCRVFIGFLFIILMPSIYFRQLICNILMSFITI